MRTKSKLKTLSPYLPSSISSAWVALGNVEHRLLPVHNISSLSLHHGHTVPAPHGFLPQDAILTDWSFMNFPQAAAPAVLQHSSVLWSPPFRCCSVPQAPTAFLDWPWCLQGHFSPISHPSLPDAAVWLFSLLDLLSQSTPSDAHGSALASVHPFGAAGALHWCGALLGSAHRGPLQSSTTRTLPCEPNTTAELLSSPKLTKIK